MSRGVPFIVSRAIRVTPTVVQRNLEGFIAFLQRVTGAAQIGIQDDGGYFDGDTVEEALQELGAGGGGGAGGLGDALVVAEITLTPTGDPEVATLDLQLLVGPDGDDPITSARDILLVTGVEERVPGQDYVAEVAFSAATTGSFQLVGDGYALARTDADGAFSCTATSAGAVTAYIWAESATRGVLPDNRCIVIATSSVTNWVGA